MAKMPSRIALLLFWLLPSSVMGVVTSDEFGSHLTTPGQPAFNVNIDGVVFIAGDTPGSETIDDLFPVCTGALISDRHILSAAHCYDSDRDGAIDTELGIPHVAAFELADRTVMISINTGEGGWGPLAVHFPNEWPLLDADVAVIQLQDDAPTGVPRYPIYGGSDELGRQFLLVGYGAPGYGATGEDLDSRPAKRAGLNRYEDDRGPNPDVDFLAYDFDSGRDENNALGHAGFESDLGFGDDEVLAGSGDSGSPNFIDGVIAGVSAFTMRLPSADVTDESDSSWGEAGFDLRVTRFQDFILEATGGTALFVPTGDFDHDGMLSANDIDLLSTGVNSGAYHQAYDLNLDEFVSAEDRRIWVVELAKTFFGDADLDGTVQLNDLVTLADAFGSVGGWAAGDFDGDGIVQFQDLVLLADNFGKSTTLGFAIPEPDSSLMLVMGIVALVSGRKVRRHVLRLTQAL